MATGYYGIIDEVRVVLVDPETENVTEMVDLLKSYDYKVITVRTSSEAMEMLSKGEKKIDVIIISVHSPNLDSFKLLAQAVILNIISLFVSDEYNELLAKKALKEGACLFLQRPLNEEIVKYLWQFVLRRKIEREKAKKGSEDGDKMIVNDVDTHNMDGDNEELSKETNDVPNTEEHRNNIHGVEDNIVSNEKYKRRRKNNRKDIKNDKIIKQKDCVKWTADLHAKFMKSLEQLGEGKCYPKDIVEVMDVPGLTRMQVASHLQKCRFNNWRSPEERKSSRRTSGQESLTESQQKSSNRKYGTMPGLQNNIPNQIQRVLEFPFSTPNTSNTFARGESSIQEKLYPPQFQVQPHYPSIDNLLNNPFFSVQNNVGGVLQQYQHRPLLEMFRSQRLQEPIVGNITHRPGSAFNTWNHHTQSEYNLDLNVVHKKTHLGSKIMPDIGVGNRTINDYNLNVNAGNTITYSGSTTMSDAENVTSDEVETINTNFPQHIAEPNMSYPSNIIATNKSDIEGSDSNEREDCDGYYNFNHMGYFFQNIRPPSANLPNSYDSEFDQVYSDD
ncbi:putative two-component response regulator ARR20 [Solanum stenotomum]|uniref:putative two-component response regulator ARR20 n=1 Tax=Solanum stenotomum TaxID=172797 RepID=UPI0020D0FD02|nr:putative two-component response regulator ARR20 [Solanum stenotomum]